MKFSKYRTLITNLRLLKTLECQRNWRGKLNYVGPKTVSDELNRTNKSVKVEQSDCGTSYTNDYNNDDSMNQDVAVPCGDVCGRPPSYA